MSGQKKRIKAEQLEQDRKLFNVNNLEDSERKVMAIASVKGGVGKTVLTASLGVSLAALGEEVILIDADFGGANLHTCMGFFEPKYTFLDYYTMERETLKDIILDSPIANLKLISGACGTLEIANPKYSQKQKLIRNLRNLQAEYVIMDLATGSSLSIIDFFLAVDDGIVVTTPEPTAIQEAFEFIKLCLIRKLQQAFRNETEILSLLEIEGLNNLTQLSAKLLNNNRIEAFLKKWQMRRNVQAHSAEYPSAGKHESDMICSVKCFYWDDCEFQNGGMPCRVRHLAPIFKF